MTYTCWSSHRGGFFPLEAFRGAPWINATACRLDARHSIGNHHCDVRKTYFEIEEVDYTTYVDGGLSIDTAHPNRVNGGGAP
eukprot:1178418-Prorocentrum_minimum.AAC.8